MRGMERRGSIYLATLIFELAVLAGGCTDDGASEETSTEDPGSLCACRELDDGALECCFGHGECVDQPEGPRRCECDPGARGETCSTPAPGVWSTRPRPCDGEDPGCAQVHDHVSVEVFDTCLDLEGTAFESVIVRPADAEGGWPSPALDGGFPVAVLVHGASQHASDYYDLLEHLAANDIVAAAFDGTVGQDVTFRANRTLSYLECLRSQWPDADRLADRYALVGHSRGGSAVAVAAEAIAEGLAADGGEIAALVALAPTTKDQFPVTQAMTPAYLALSGARDPDTRGAALGWFDRAGAEDPSFVRSIVWIHGATHQRFHQGLLFANTGEQQASLSSEGHWAVARAYIGGFLQWQLLGRDALRPTLSGAVVPDSVALHYADEPGVHAGLRQAGLASLVVHDFDAEALSPSNVGGIVESTGLSTSLGELAELDAPWSDSHRGRGLRLDWAAGDEAALRFELPPELGDLSSFAAVSLGVGRVFDAPESCGEPGLLAALSLVLHDAEGSVELPLSELGAIGSVPAPDRLVPEVFGSWITPECHAQDFVRPLRVPLQLACDLGLDPTSVEAIELHVDTSVAGGLLLDHLALERGGPEPAGCG